MKKRKTLWLAVVVAMIFQMIAPIGPIWAVPNEIASGQRVDTSTIEIYRPVPDGRLIPPEEYSNIPSGAKVIIKYSFELLSDNGIGNPLDPESGYVAYDYNPGDYFTFEFPPVIKFENLAGSSIDIATLSLEDSSTIKVTLTDNIEDEIEGTFIIEGTFNVLEGGTGEGEEIEFQFPGLPPTRITVYPPEPEPEVSVNVQKDGQWNAAEDKIDWEVTVEVKNNGEATTSAGISIIDTFSNNQTYKDGSLQVQKDGGSFESTSPSAISDESLTYEISELAAGTTVYTLRYSTVPKADAFGEETEGEDTKVVDFNNTAAVWQNSKILGQDSATVQLNRIEKMGAAVTTAGDDIIIGWTIIINKDGGTLENAKITDTLGHGLELVPDSVQFGDDLDSLAPVLVGDYGLTGTGELTDPYVLTYEIGTITGQKVLYYQTKITDRDEFLKENAGGKFKNHALLEWNGTTGSSAPSDGAEVGIGVGGIITKKTTDPEPFAVGQQIPWEVRINQNNINITALVVFTDKIPAGMEFVPGSFAITPLVAEKTDTGYETGSIGYDEGTRTLSYTFSGSIKYGYRITYNTRVVSADSEAWYNNAGDVTFMNEAQLSGGGILGGSQKSTDTKTLNSQVLSKQTDGSPAYDYVTQKAHWKIVVNRNKLTLAGATIKDTLPVGMAFDQSSFQVFNSAGAFVPYGDIGVLSYTAPAPDADINTTQEEFTYQFTNAISDQYTITFDTIMKKGYLKENQFSNKDFENEAKLTTTTYPDKEIISTAKVQVKNPIVQKIGNYTNGDDFIDWRVPINVGKVQMDKVSLSDQLIAKLKLEPTSVVLYRMNVKPDGSLEVNSIVPKAADDIATKTEYGYSYDEVTNLFTVDIPLNTSDTYQLEFTTYVMTESRETLTNEIILTGYQSGSVNSPTQTSIVVDRQSGFGSTSSGKITILKVDAADSTTALEGATFKVRDIFFDKEIASAGGTDATGAVVYNKLKYRPYEITELVPPYGYLKNTTAQQVVLNKTDKKEQTVTFTNTKAFDDIEFTKMDNSSPRQALSGVVFELYDSNGLVDTQTSGLDGKVKFGPLPMGTYTLKETGPLPNYLSARDVTVVIGYKPGSDYTETAVTFNPGLSIGGVLVNNKAVGNIVFTKKSDAAGNPNLGGAEFTLYDAGGNVVQTATSSTTGNIGRVTFSNVPIGEYTIKETKAPAGHFRSEHTIKAVVAKSSKQANGSEVMVVTLTALDTATANEGFTPSSTTSTNGVFKNEKAYGGVEFFKYDTAGAPLGGSRFTIYKIGTGGAETAYQTATSTDGTGKVQFTNLEVGDYVIREVEPTYGYLILPGTVGMTVKVEVDAATQKLVVMDTTKIVNVSNEKAYVDIEFTKVDDLNPAQTLSGAGFTLYASNGTTIVRPQVLSDGSGVVKFTGLEMGTYILKETAPLANHLSTQDITVEIGYPSVGGVKDYTKAVVKFPSWVVDGKVVNKKALGNIEFTKISSAGGNLSGAEFALYGADGTTPVTDGLGQEITATSAPNGKVTFSNIPIGTYTIKETNAPAGHLRSTHTIKADVAKSGKQTDGSEIMVVTLTRNAGTDTDFNPTDKTFRNEKAYGKIEFYKYAAGGDYLTDGLKDAEFALYKAGSPDAPIIKSSAADGKVEFAGLEAGDYIIREVKPSEGYLLLGNSDIHVTVAVNGAQNGVTVSSVTNVTNQRALMDIVFTKQDGLGNHLGAVGFTLKAPIGGDKTVVSDADTGEVKFEKLPMGTYTLKETGPLPNYLSARDITVVIGYASKPDGSPDYTQAAVTFTPPLSSGNVLVNQGVLGDIAFTKISSDAGAKLAGAEFVLYEIDGTTPVKDGLGEDIKAISNGLGEVIFKDVPLGTYIVKESDAPAGHRRSDATIKAEVKKIDNPSGDGSEIVSVVLSQGTGDDYNAVANTFTNEKAYGSIVFYKHEAGDSARRLSGAEFAIYRKGDEATTVKPNITTSADGKVEFTSLEVGEYVIKEVNPPHGYLRLEDAVNKINVTIAVDGTDQKTVTVTSPYAQYPDIANQKALGRIEFTKRSSDGSVLPGAVFTLCDNTGVPIVPSVTATSGADGKVVFENVELGSYKIKETKPPVGYYTMGKDANAEISVTVDYNDDKTGVVIKDGTGAIVTSLADVTNEKAYGEIVLTKVSNAGGNLAGATFTLYNEHGAVVTDAGGNAVTATSTATGEVRFNNIDLGKYTIKETNAPEGYYRSRAEIEVEVKLEAPYTTVVVALAPKMGPDSTDFDGVAKTFTNHKAYYTVEFTKVDAADAGLTLAGAKFELYKIEAGGTEVFQKDITTVADGIVKFENLEVGQYVIREADSPGGYLLGNADIAVTIGLDGEQRNVIDPQVPGVVTNQKALGRIEFTKWSSDGAALPGAVFTLYDNTGAPIVPSVTATSGADGKVVFENVPLGSYQIKETKTPDGHFTMNKDANAVISVTVAYNDPVAKTSVVVSPVADVTNEKAYGKVEFTKKTDSGNNLQGALFALYKKDDSVNAIRTATSGVNGEVVFDNLEVGSYIIKEVDAPEGYYRSLYGIEVEVSLNGNHTVLTTVLSENKDDFDASISTFINKKAYGDIEFTKTSNRDGNLAGATFELYEKGNATVLQTGTSGADGKVVFTNLPVGTYILKEVKAADGHYLLEDPIEIEHKLDDETQRVLSVVLSSGEAFSEVVNTKAVGPVEFQKQTSYGQPLGGAEFTMYKKGTTDIVATAKSDNKGVVKFDDIPVGEYEIKETRAPAGFFSTNDVIEVKLEIINNKLETTLSQNIVKNTPIPQTVYGSIEINKVDGNNKALSGATFELINANGTVVQTGTSDSDGKVKFDFVVLGKYTIRETAAPEGFVLESRDIEVTLNTVETRTFTIVNKEIEKEILGSITVVKTDSSSKRLAGAEFILFDKDGKELARAVSGSDGVVVFDKLPLENYIVQESSAPEGYQLNNQKMSVTVSDEKTSTITVINKKTDEPGTPGPGPEKPDEPGTPGNPAGKGSILINKIDIASKPLAGAEFTLFDANGKVIAAAKSGSDGVVAFRNLIPGIYQVQETSAPDGYILVADRLAITVVADKEIKYNFRNIEEDELIDNEIPLGWIPVEDNEIPEGGPKPGGKLPQAGEMIDTFVMVAAGAILVLLGSGQLIYRRRLRKSEK